MINVGLMKREVVGVVVVKGDFGRFRSISNCLIYISSQPSGIIEFSGLPRFHMYLLSISAFAAAY